MAARAASVLQAARHADSAAVLSRRSARASEGRCGGDGGAVIVSDRCEFRVSWCSAVGAGGAMRPTLSPVTVTVIQAVP